jgi:hypothetical protein
MSQDAWQSLTNDAHVRLDKASEFPVKAPVKFGL